MAGFDHVVVAIGSPEGDCSLMGYAAVLARLGGAREVRFAHVAGESVSAADLRQAMRAQVDKVFRDTHIATTCDVLHGSLTDRLLAYVSEQQADLILIGSKKHRLGARLAMVAPCSVAVVPNNHPATLSHLMIACDFSAAATETLQWATRLIAADRAIRCTAVHVVTHESTDLFGDSDGEAEQAHAMRTLLAGADRSGVPVEARLVNVERSTDLGHSHPFSPVASIQGIDVAQTILQEAERSGADCIALNTRGRSRSASILLGSVTEKVIERAKVPLLVHKHGGRNLGLASILLGRAGWYPGIKTN